MRRAILGVLLAAAILAGWEWAAGPAVIDLPGADPGTCHLTPAGLDPAGRYLDIAQFGDRPKFWALDAHAGTAAGPWPNPAYVTYLAFDAAGQMRVFDHLQAANDRSLTAWRIGPDGKPVVAWERPDCLGVRLIDPPGGAAAVVLRGGGGEPLRAELLDLLTGAARRRLDFPDRRGVVGLQDAETAAGGWDVSADGRLLALAEAWSGRRRVGPPGVAVFDFDTGTLQGRVAEQPGDRGAADLSFAAGGRELWLSPFTRDPAGAHPPLEPTQGWDWRTGRRLPDPPPPPDPDAKQVFASDDGLTLWERKADERVELRVTTGDGRPTPWVTADPNVVRPGSAEFLAGTASVAFAGQLDSPDWADKVPLVGRWPAGDRHRLSVLNWQTGRLRTVRTYSFSEAGGSLYTASVPGRLVAVATDWRTGRAWVEVWRLPLWPPPPLWLWPLGLAAGGLAGWRTAGRGKWSVPAP